MTEQPLEQPPADDTGLFHSGKLSTTDDVADDPTMDPRTREHLHKLRNENKSLRGRLREIESNYEATTAQLAESQRAEVERIAAQVLIDPADVWRVDADTSQAFIDTEFHGVVGDNVVAAAKALAASKPHLAKPQAGPPPTDRPIEGLRPGATPSDTKSKEITWASALRNR